MRPRRPATRRRQHPSAFQLAGQAGPPVAPSCASGCYSGAVGTVVRWRRRAYTRITDLVGDRRRPMKKPIVSIPRTPAFTRGDDLDLAVRTIRSVEEQFGDELRFRPNDHEWVCGARRVSYRDMMRIVATAGGISIGTSGEVVKIDFRRLRDVGDLCELLTGER